MKVAVDAVNNAANAPAGANPRAVAQNAVAEATKLHAPHLLNGFSNGGRDWVEAPRRQKHSGHWARQGRQIILFGV